MRILVVTTSYPRCAGDASGHFVRAHARQLAATEAEVVVVAPGAPGEVDDEGADAGAGRIRVVRTRGEALFAWPGAIARARERPGRLLVGPATVARAARAVRREGPFDRAIAHWIVPSAFPVLEGVSAPLELVAHGADVRVLAALPRPVRAAVVSRLLGRAARVRFVAATLRDDLARLLPARLAERLLVAADVEPLPIDVPDRAALGDPRSTLGLASGARYVAWVGRMIAGKRPQLAIEAAGRASARLVIVGDGPELEAARAACRTRPAADVVLAGRLPRDRALAVLAGAEALLHTSAAEGAPTVVREARALGVPVVACPSGDLAAWAAVDPGIVLAAADAAALGAALRRVMMVSREAA